MVASIIIFIPRGLKFLLMHSFNKHLPSTYYMPSCPWCCEESGEHEAQPPSCGADVLEGKTVCGHLVHLQRGPLSRAHRSYLP